MKMMMIEAKPWDRIERRDPFNYPLVLKEFSGVVSQPSDANVRLFAANKIRRIEFL